MTKYEKLVKQMRFCAEDCSVVECRDKCPNFGDFRPYEYCTSKLIAEAADAIEELEEKAMMLAETLAAGEKRGFWEWRDYGSAGVVCVCSECGGTNAVERRFCPDCGAVMIPDYGGLRINEGSMNK